MRLSNLKSAWEQLKVQNAMQSLDSGEILAIIGGSEQADKTKLKAVLLNLAMFIIITIFCQGG